MMYGPSDVPFRVGTSSIGPHGTSGKGKGGKGDGKGKVNVSAHANLYYYALEHGLLAETLEEQERQGTASSQDGGVMVVVTRMMPSAEQHRTARPK